MARLTLSSIVKMYLDTLGKCMIDLCNLFSERVEGENICEIVNCGSGYSSGFRFICQRV